MNLNRAALITALSLASKVAPRATQIPVLSHALLRPLPQQRLELVATDLETTVILELPHDGEPLSAPTLAPITWLLKLLKNMDGPEVVMNRTTITAEGMGANAITMYEERAADAQVADFPATPNPWGFNQVQLPGLTQALRFAYDAASVDPARYALNNVQLVATKKEVSVNATDGHRLYRAWLPPTGVIYTGLVPAGLLDLAAAKKLIQPDLLYYGKAALTKDLPAQEYIAMRVNGTGVTGWVVAREVSGTFPNVAAVTPADTTATRRITMDPTVTIKIVKQAIALSTDRRPAAMELVVRDGALKIHPHGCNMELPVPGATVDGLNMIIGINGHYLHNALVNLTDPAITMRAKDPGSPIWFSEGRGKSKRVIVIMPMRTDYVGLQAGIPVESLPKSATQ